MGVLLYLGLVTAGQTLRTYQLHQEEDRLKEEIALLEAKNRSLQAQEEYYASDAYLEKSAREDLNLIKPGETAVVVIPAPTPTPAAPAAAPPAAPGRPAWQRWWEFFFGSG